MQKQLNLYIPEPCHQDWNAMTQKEQGRHCSSCDKIVIDFSQMNGQEIILYFKVATDSGICGRFKKSQLSSAIPIPAEVTVSFFRRYLSSPIQRMAAVFFTGIIFFLSSCKPGFTQGEIKALPREMDTLTDDSIIHEIIKPDDSLKNKPTGKHPVKLDDEDLNLKGNVITIPEPATSVLPDNESMISGKIAFQPDSTQH